MAKTKSTPISESAIVKLGFKKVMYAERSSTMINHYYEYEFKNVDLTLLADHHDKRNKWRVNIYEGGTSYFPSLEVLTAFIEIVKKLKIR